MLEKKKPREQSGRDSLARYKAQSRAAAMASLSILEGGEIDRVYCDLHDDFVVRKQDENGFSYIFFQVKTKGKQNHNWTLSEIFGLDSRIKDQRKQSNDKIKDSFAGKLLLHTVVFDQYCNSVVFQTNINNHDDVESLLDDIRLGTFANKFAQVLEERFNQCFKCSDKKSQYSQTEIRQKLAKLEFQTDVQHLKGGDNDFEPRARDQIFKFSEIDLTYTQSREILLKLLELVERKSSGVIAELTNESIEKLAGISIDDLLDILSISRDAYHSLVNNGDEKAIKSVSIIQRTLHSAGAGGDEIEYCSRCKTDWDIWLRENRHQIPELDLVTITNKVRDLLYSCVDSNGLIKLGDLRTPIHELRDSLESNDLLFDLTLDALVGGVFSELVKGKS